jgi:tetratricopeptide (TPR) repeat protein
VNPRASFAEAIAACERASAEKPDTEAHSVLSAVNFALGNYEAEHGGDPDRLFERSAHELEEVLRVRDESGLHYNLGRLWSSRARYQANHGHDPNQSVDAALEQYNITLRMSPSRDDAPAAMGDAVIARARYLQAEHRNAQATIEEARRALDRSLAMNPRLVPPIKFRVELAELDAEALLERRTDPTSALEAIRAGAKELLRRRSMDHFSHLMLCRAELLAARWALASGRRADTFLTQAAIEAARAREADATDASVWTASAEVELLRAEATQRQGGAAARAIAAGNEFIEEAMKIDPRLRRTLAVRDALARLARTPP